MTSELSPADIAAVTGNNGGGGNSGFGGFGNDGSWWIIILLLFEWGRNGFGNGGGGGGGSPCATQADVRAAVDQQTLISKLDQQTYGLADSTYALNNTIVNGFHGVDRELCDLSHQFSDCCCQTQRAIDGVKYDMATQFCDTRNLIQSTTRDLIDNQNCNSRAILDFLTQDKLSALTAENQSLKLAASQASQNAYLIGQLRPAPVPAYQVQNPNCCYSGCGCGCA